MTATAFRTVSPMFLSSSELVSRFSSDGEESFVTPPQWNATMVQDPTGPEIVINGKADAINMGAEVSPRNSLRFSSPGQVPKHSTLLRRLTTKLRITTPPSSPPSNILSFFPLAPTYTPTAPLVNSFISTELSESVLREHGLIVPDPSHPRREAQDVYTPIVQHKQNEGKGWKTEAERVKEMWITRRASATTAAAESTEAVSTPKRKGPIYPDVLTIPEFGRSRSTPDLTQLDPSRLPTVSRNDSSAATQSTVMAAASRHMLLEAPQVPKLTPRRHRTSSSASSPPIFLSPHNWMRSARDVSSLFPVEVNVPFASSTSLASGSSRSCVSSSRNSFLSDERLVHCMSTGFTLPSDPVSGGSLEKAFANDSVGTTRGNRFGLITKNLDIERRPIIIKKHAEDCEVASSIDVQVEGDPDIARLSFPSREGPGSHNGEETSTIRSRPVDLCTAARDTDSFKGSRRRKSFVEQSFQNLRKSITVTISRARPRQPSKSLPHISTTSVPNIPSSTA